MSKNNDDFGVVMVVAFFGSAILAMAILACAIACFIAFIITIVAILSWNEPLTVKGHVLLFPEEARIFVGSGILGAVGVTGFVLFCSLVFGFPVEANALLYIAIGGYSLVSLSVMMNGGVETQVVQDSAARIPVIEHDPGPAVPALPAPSASEPAPFRYASWDDEVAEAEQPRSRCEACQYGQWIIEPIQRPQR